MKNKLFLIAMLVFSTTFSLKAQLNVGSTAAPDASAVLQASSSSKGFLPPVMTTVQRSAIVNPAVGLIIYNSATGCLEYYNGTTWKSSCSSNVTATYTASTLACTGAQAGSFIATVPMTAGNTKTVTVTTVVKGDYSIATDAQNGVSFSASGTIDSIGPNKIITMVATGNPMAAGNYTYTTTLSGQTCTFVIAFGNPPSTTSAFSCQTGTGATGTYYTGNAMVAANNTKTITVTPTTIGYYNYTTDAQNGITFAVSGAYIANQLGVPQTLLLVATGTPVVAGPFTYTLSGTGLGSTCTFIVTTLQSVQYLQATPIAGQAITAVGTDVTFASTINSVVSVSGANFTLKAGKTYILKAAMAGPSNGWVDFQWVNAANVALPTGNAGLSISGGVGYIDQAIATAIVVVSGADMVVKLRSVQVASVTTTTIEPWRSYATVEEVPTSSQYLYTNASAQAISAVNTDVVFTPNIANGLSVSGSAITLKAGKTYLVMGAVIGNPSANSTYYDFVWVNAFNSPYATANNGISIAARYGNFIGQSLSTAIVEAGSTDITIKLRTVLGQGTITVDPNRTFAIVKEIQVSSSYMTLKPVAGQTASVGGTDVSFTATSARNLSVSGASITLKAGKTYRLSAAMGGGGSTTNTYTEFIWVDAANVALPASSTGFSIVGTYSNFISDPVATSLVVVGSTDKIVKLRSVSGGGSFVIDNTRSFGLVEEIGITP